MNSHLRPVHYNQWRLRLLRYLIRLCGPLPLKYPLMRLHLRILTKPFPRIEGQPRVPLRGTTTDPESTPQQVQHSALVLGATGPSESATGPIAFPSHSATGASAAEIASSTSARKRSATSRPSRKASSK